MMTTETSPTPGTIDPDLSYGQAVSYLNSESMLSSEQTTTLAETLFNIVTDKQDGFGTAVTAAMRKGRLNLVFGRIFELGHGWQPVYIPISVAAQYLQEELDGVIRRLSLATSTDAIQMARYCCERIHRCDSVDVVCDAVERLHSVYGQQGVDKSAEIRNFVNVVIATFV